MSDRPTSPAMAAAGAGGSARPGHRVTRREAAAILAARDPVLSKLIAAAGPIRFRRSKLAPFAALVQAIVYQQLAGAAARAIHNRLLAALDGHVEPQRLLALSDETLRSVGLSANKARSLRDLASKVSDGTVVVSPRGLSRKSDEEVIAQLTTVRGIGPWSAQMFLMFQLRRLDVWPALDFGVRRGYSLTWRIPTPSAREFEPLGDRFRPYRSVVAWYCWRAVELQVVLVEGANAAATERPFMSFHDRAHTAPLRPGPWRQGGPMMRPPSRPKGPTAHGEPRR